MVFRIDSPGSQGGAWVGGSPFAGVSGTVISADWMNAFQEELVSLVEAEGLAPSKLDATQVRQAVLRLVARVAGVELSFTAGAALTAGQGLLSGDAFGVVKATVGIGGTAVLQVLGTFTLPKVSGDAITLHQRVYWNAGTSQVTTTAGGNRSIGVSTAAAGAGTTSVSVLLSGPPNL
jgi:predicted RecA/RadA family phage recombinase